ncbi:MAG: protein kinase [Anaerolineae bacterium]|nr:protein kinase [Anaerolineae bacterium]
MSAQVFGPYQIVDTIGVGGMATVYRAYQTTMDRYVALKILPRQLSEDPTFLKRFQREARTVARLEHKSMVPVYDYGEIDGQPYIVMRLIDGGTLRKRIYYDDLDLPVITRVTEQIAEALDYAHQHGVVHRDLKPSNILLDHNNNAYLTDFGISKMLDSTSQITSGSGVVGTPTYMSPEQCQGKEVTPASDIYALGVILYEMLAGYPPYQAEAPLSVMYMHVKDPVPSIITERPDLPPEVEGVIQCAMAKAPAARYPSAAALAAGFQQAIGWTGGTSRRTTPAPIAAPRPAPPGPSVDDDELSGEIVAYGDDDEEAFTDSADVEPQDEPTLSGSPAVPRRAPGRAIQTTLTGMVGLTVLLGIGVIGVLAVTMMRGGGGRTAGVPTLPPPPTHTPIMIVVEPSATPSPTIIPPSPTSAVIEPTVPATLTPLPPTVVVIPPTATATRILPTATITPTRIPPSATPTRPTSTPTATLTLTPTVTVTQPPASTGGRIAFTRGVQSAAEIALMDDNGQNVTVLTSNGYYDGEPDWSPDGTRLAYESDVNGNTDLFIMNAQGSGIVQITSAAEPDRHPDWQPNGQTILFESGSGDGAELYVVNPDGTNLTRLTNNSTGDRTPRFSPDGTRIAFMTNQRGKWEIAVMDYPSGGNLRIYDCPGADCRFPAWAPDGTQIVYNTLVGAQADKIYTLNVSTGQSSLLVDGFMSGRADWAGNGVFVYFNREVSGITQVYRIDLSTRLIEMLTQGTIDNYGPDWR